MSHYFQQLFVSSGLVRPATPISATSLGHLSNTPGLEEISEERIAPPAGSASGASIPQPTSDPIPLFRSAIGESRDINQPTTSKLEATESAAGSGVIEIGQSIVDESPSITRSVANIVAASPLNPTLPAATDIAAKKTASPTSQESSPATAKQEASTPAPALTSRDELIEHVFRWVGENPKNVVPAALSDTTKTAEPLKTPKQAMQPQTESQLSPVSAPFQVVQTNAPGPSPAAPTRNRPQTSVVENDTRETSVEISIGTLQIQVEAPPASSAKPAHRPAAPRALARRPIAAAQPPAIDINRLRRGFYL